MPVVSREHGTNMPLARPDDAAYVVAPDNNDARARQSGPAPVGPVAGEVVGSVRDAELLPHIPAAPSARPAVTGKR